MPDSATANCYCEQLQLCNRLGICIIPPDEWHFLFACGTDAAESLPPGHCAAVVDTVGEISDHYHHRHQ